jgi:hypothetical protein
MEVMEAMIRRQFAGVPVLARAVRRRTGFGARRSLAMCEPGHALKKPALLRAAPYMITNDRT